MSDKPYVNLSDGDGNVFSIIARCQQAMCDHGMTCEEIDAFVSEALSSDYNHLVETVKQRFDWE